MSNQVDPQSRPRPVRRRQKPQSIPGTSGYRLRNGRTGLDPIDNAREASFAEGKFIRTLFTGRLRITSGLGLSIMAVMGVVFVMPPILFYVVPLLEGVSVPVTFFDLCFLLPLALIGLALLANTVLSLKQNGKKR